MPQLQLPLFPIGSTLITSDLAFMHENDTITYFYGTLPIFSHPKTDIRSFKMITAQFCINGHTRQAEIARAFGIPAISVKRAVHRYRSEGPAGFYRARKSRGPAVLTAEVIGQVQQALVEQEAVADIAVRLGLKTDTLNKAIRAGRLQLPVKKKTCPR